MTGEDQFPKDVLVGGVSWSRRWANRPLSLVEIERVIHEMSPADLIRPESAGWEWVEMIGERKTPDGARNLVIGRCSEDRFSCRLWDDVDGEMIVVDRDETDDSIPVFLGDKGETSRKWTTSLDSCLVAVRAFWMDGSIAQTLPWEAV